MAAVAVVGAAAVLAVTQRAPLTATVLAVELTHAGFALLGPVLLAVGGATAVSRMATTAVASGRSSFHRPTAPVVERATAGAA